MSVDVRMDKYVRKGDFDLLEAYSCVGRFKQEVIEQYAASKQGKSSQDISG